MLDFIEFLMNFWTEIDRLYNNRSIAIPLLGSGITRFEGYELISDQELLEIIIWSYKISRIKFAYPATINFVLDERKKDKINLYKIKEEKYSGL